MQIKRPASSHSLLQSTSRLGISTQAIPNFHSPKSVFSSPKDLKNILLQKNVSRVSTASTHLSRALISPKNSSILDRVTLYSPPPIRPDSANNRNYILPTFKGPHMNSDLVKLRYSRDNSRMGSPLLPQKFSIGGKKAFPMAPYQKIEIDRTKEYADPNFIQKVKLKLKEYEAVDHPNKILIYFPGSKKYISIVKAKKILKFLFKDLESIYSFKQPSRTKQSQLEDLNTKIEIIFQQQYSILEDLDSKVTDMLTLIDKCIADRKFKLKVDNHAKAIADVARDAQNREILLLSYFVAGKIFYEYSDYDKALEYFRLYKNSCKLYGFFESKLKSYKYIGKCYQEAQKNDKALLAFSKYLQMAWHNKSLKDELQAYDSIGFQYYYMGEIELANYFHDKMSQGKPESEDSHMRQLGISRVMMQKNADAHKIEKERKRPIYTDPDEDYRGLSSIDEIDIATQPEKEEEELGQLQRKKSLGMDKVILGKMKARIAENIKNKKYEKKRLTKGKLILKAKNKNQKTVTLTLTHSSVISLHPQDISHLEHQSRNRQMKNFALISKTKDDVAKKSGLESYDTFNVRSTNKIKSYLEKIKINLLLIKLCLELCVSDSKERETPPVLSKRSSASYMENSLY